MFKLLEFIAKSLAFLPRVSAWITSIWTGLVAYIAAKLTVATAMYTVFIAGLITLYLFIVDFLGAVVDSYSSSIPSFVVDGASMFLPSNTIPVLTLVLSLRIFHMIYLWLRYNYVTAYQATKPGGF